MYGVGIFALVRCARYIPIALRMSISKFKINTVRQSSGFVILVGFLLLACAFRIAVAHWLPNDAPDDGRVYAQMARNVLEQHVYSHDAQPPFEPSLIRLPGYPLFLAGVYSIFGHTNNGAVRIVQALIDTATCGLIALLAFYWQPDEKKKVTSAIVALALAAICPFTTIYAATILTEVLTNFLMIAMFVAVTLAFRKLTTEDTEEDRKKNFKRAFLWWIVAGLLGGLNVLFRPDSGLFVGAVGVTLTITMLWSAVRPKMSGFPLPKGEGASDPKRRRRFALPAHSKKYLSRALASGAIFSIAFLIILTPWTIRNWRVFHLFQPLAPAHGEMPGEFVPRGYYLWLRTWLDDESYIAPFLWSLDTDPIDIDDVPSYAFDSTDEQKRVATLLEAYNSERDSDASDSDSTSKSNASPTPQSNPTPAPQASSTTTSKSPIPTASNKPTPQTNAKPNANVAKSKSDEDNEDSDDNSSSEADQSQSEQTQQVEMTPEIDAAFGQLARERIARHPFRFYVLLPLKRAHTMWFDTHSQYWPFVGTLLPFSDLDREHQQQVWLPLFAALTAVYTLLGLAGMWLLWSSGTFDARRWLLLIVLAIVLRLILFSSIENPEPRYLVEFFPFLSVLGGIAIAQISKQIRKPQIDTDEHR